ncbi:hypothetical protein [Nitrosophilus labii]|uniref:hypothetical protein n=1 Tax=Nitrosophilus labii TaxID=2706014 RepID=UPI001656931F|nr:hypothetical protein [Nitrosophilus labii]
MGINKKYEECMNELLKNLENEFMKILSNPKLDKKQKNLLTKPLVTKKQILLNTLDALNLVDKESEK